MTRAVIVLFCGWYLLLPPITGKSTFPLVDTDAPFARWVQVGSYDSATECASEQTKRGLKVTEPNYHEMLRGDAAEAINALCIASDDPRLKRH